MCCLEKVGIVENRLKGAIFYNWLILYDILIGELIMQRGDQVFRKNENFVFRQIDDETILVPIKNNVGDMGSIYNLNEVGAYVWENLDGKKTLSDIKNRITGEFEISPKVAEEDLIEFVDQLEEIEAILPPGNP